jgi:glycosyltransferase involved in cell wall biosynthesis
VSKDDCHRFSSLYGISPGLLPNGVDCGPTRRSQAEIDAARKRYNITDESILFMGLYAYPPNKEGVRFLVEEVLPALYRMRPRIRLVVTGGDVPLSYPWLIAPGVLSRGDLECVLGACQIGVAPIFSGSGTRLKILEYMAAGLPVVTTRKGAEGLDAEDGKHVLYAETAREFQGAIVRLLDDQAVSKRLSSVASAFVREKYDWSPLLQAFASQLARA